MTGINMANMKAKTGHPHDASKHLQENYNKQTQLNTYIYEYFLHNSMFQCAQSILKADSDVRVQRHSPGSDRHDKGLRLKNPLRNKTIDSRLDSTNSNLLPAPNVPNLSPGSCFLNEWFCLFWAMFNAQRNENKRIEACQYACHIQVSLLEHAFPPNIANMIRSNKTGQSGMLAGRRPKAPYYYCRLRAVPPITPSITLAKWA